MEIKLWNTLSGKKEVFTPLKKNLFGKPKVGMYHCGPTVYNYIHIGNLRAFFLADIVRRLFEANGYNVTQVMNITDVGLLESDNAEDKMTQALKREGKPLTLEAMHELADFYTKAFIEDLKALNIEMPHKLPKASEHIDEDIKIVKKLEKKGLTYKIADGIYFDTSKINDYGKLGHITALNEEQSRIGMNSEKKNPRDFALWKLNPSLGWESPWGKGFPGWHIECSAMSMKYLGETFDIHTGGIDLIPIHHNNEIAQSEHATNKTFARFWLHNAFVNIGEAKMAKSAGNFITLKTLIEEGYTAMDYRYLLLGARYSTPLNFSYEALGAAATTYKRLKEGINQDKLFAPGTKTQKEIPLKYEKKLLEFMGNDLDTPSALALLHTLIQDADLKESEKVLLLKKFDKVLGLDLFTPEPKVKIPFEIEKLVKEREFARDQKNWQKSDELRDKINSLGFVVKDTPEGQKVHKK